MKGSFRLFRVFGIDIKVHVTFFILILLALQGGIRWISVVLGIFFFVTIHELCHSLVARSFGIKVREITLLPIGGIASMTAIPRKPLEEFAISLAGPLFNIAVVVLMFFPLKMLLGPEALFHPLSSDTWPLAISYVYWINLVLAGFNLLPSFPMDGGRIFRAILAWKLGFERATHIAVGVGQAFAVIFAFIGITRLNFVLVFIAVFIYFSASNEEVQIDVHRALKKIRINDILPRTFVTLASPMPLSEVLELIFKTRQEHFPVVDNGELTGFMTRQDIMDGLHQHGVKSVVGDCKRKRFPHLKDTDTLAKAALVLQDHEMAAAPVLRNGVLAGIITLEDMTRVYAVMSRRTRGA